MMKKVCQNLNRYFDQELEMAQRKEFSAHLDQCSDCQKKLQFLQDLAKISASSVSSTPEECWQLISANLPSTYQFGHLWWQKMAIAACFALFAVVGSLSGNYFYEDYNTPNLNDNSIYSYLEENL